MEQNNILNQPIETTLRSFNTDTKLKTTRIRYKSTALNCKGVVEITETMKFSYGFSPGCVLCNHKTPCFSVFNISRKIKRSESTSRRRSTILLRSRSAKNKRFKFKSLLKEDNKENLNESLNSENESLNLQNSIEISGGVEQAKNNIMIDLKSKKRIIKDLTSFQTKEFKRENKLLVREIHYLKRIKEFELEKLSRLKSNHKKAFTILKKELKEKGLNNYFEIDEIIDSNEEYIAFTRQYTETLKKGLQRAIIILNVFIS